MKKLLFILPLCLVSQSVFSGNLPFSDPFAYTAGNNLIGQSNPNLFSAWYARSITGSGGNQPTILVGNLDHTNLPPSTSNSVSFFAGPNHTACLDLNLP